MNLPPPREARRFAELAEKIFDGKPLDDLISSIDGSIDGDLRNMSWSELSRKIGAEFGTTPDASVAVAITYQRHMRGK